MSKVAIFASGTGSNADRILHFLTRKQSPVKIDCIVTNKLNAGVYAVAQQFGIPIFHFTNTAFAQGVEILELLKKRHVNWIILAGFLRKIEANIVNEYQNRIFNIHPSLLPKYGGKGMYGKLVHKAVIDASEAESGISIHLVNDEFDKGEILFQAKCTVEKGQTVEELAQKIQKLEHQYFPQVIEEYINNN